MNADHVTTYGTINRGDGHILRYWVTCTCGWSCQQVSVASVYVAADAHLNEQIADLESIELGRS